MVPGFCIADLSAASYCPQQLDEDAMAGLTDPGARVALNCTVRLSAKPGYAAVVRKSMLTFGPSTLSNMVVRAAFCSQAFISRRAADLTSRLLVSWACTNSL